MKIETIQEAINRGWYDAPMSATQSEYIMLVKTASLEVLKLFPKFEQIAFYVPDMDAAKSRYKGLGCTNWVNDIVTAQGTVGKDNDKRKETIINVAHLAFNYELGTELELIRYMAGDNWHRDGRRVDENGNCSFPFQSHMSYHVIDMAGERVKLERAGFRVIQSVHTISHTNPLQVSTGRHYHYVIFDTRALLGFDVKLIQRLERQ